MKMKKAFLFFVIALLAFAAITMARQSQPRDGNSRSYTDLNFYGASYVVITTTTSWTSVMGVGILYDAYVVCKGTATAGVVAFRTASDTNVVVIPDITVAADADRAKIANSNMGILTLNLAVPIWCPNGLKVRQISGNFGETGTGEGGSLMLFFK